MLKNLTQSAINQSGKKKDQKPVQAIKQPVFVKKISVKTDSPNKERMKRLSLQPNEVIKITKQHEDPPYL